MIDECLFDMAPILFDNEPKNPILPSIFHPSDLFKTLTYNLYWFDMDYPNNKYSGYKQKIKESFLGVPFQMLNSVELATYELNTKMANTQFILILTGRNKKSLLKNIHNSAGIQKIFVIKLFSKLNLSEWYKVEIMPDFPTLISAISKIIQPVNFVRKSSLLQDQYSLINFSIKADPMIMTEQCTRIIEYELNLQSDRKRSKYKYSLALGIMYNYFNEMKQNYGISNDINEIHIPFFNALVNEKYIDSSNDTKIESLDIFLKLLELGIMFDSANFIISPLSITQISSFLNNETFSYTHFKLALLKSIELLKYKNCDLNDGAFQSLHKDVIIYLRNAQIKKGSKNWENLHLTHMLLSDLDLCIKLFIEQILSNDTEFTKLQDEFSKASMVSDTRISIMKEIWERGKFIPDPTFAKEFSEKELNCASKNCIISRLISFCTDTEMQKIELVLKNYKFSDISQYDSYSFIHDFEISESVLHTSQNKNVYVLLSQNLKRCEFLLVLNICVKFCITPIFIIYAPLRKNFLKETFRNSWTLVIIYCETIAEIANFIKNKEVTIFQQMQYCRNYYGDFTKTLNAVLRSGSNKNQEKIQMENLKIERDGGWELLSGINKDIFVHLVEEKILGAKLSGSLHYNVYNLYRSEKKQEIYWQNYGELFGVTERYLHELEYQHAKKLLQAYTLQTNPGFYKLLNDAFRSGNPEKIGNFRSFYMSLLTMVKHKLLRKYTGSVYRGTYFNPSLLKTLEIGTKMYSTCFTSTSKSIYVAQAFARKTNRNVLLEIELDKETYSNVDIHIENISKFPEEYEVLLLPFAAFEIMGMYQDLENNLTLIRLKEKPSEISVENFKTVDYYS